MVKSNFQSPAKPIKMNHSQHIIEKMIAAKEAVMQLMHWTEKEYNEYQVKMGCQYLQGYIPQCPDEIDALINNRIFWNWWRNEWLFRDTAFITSDVDQLKPSTRQQIYLNINDADVLRHEIFPSGVVLNCHYANMIREIQKDIAC
jgi:hypothetical protein